MPAKVSRSRWSGEFSSRVEFNFIHASSAKVLLLDLPAACCAFTFLACCAIGPDFHTPSVPDVTSFTPEALAPKSASAGSGEGQGQHFVQNRDIPGLWWDTFHSRALTDLVEDSLKHNADLQAAQAALHVAVETAVAARGGFYPQVAGSFVGLGGRESQIVSSPLASGSLNYTLYTPQLTISYVPDVFGLTARSVESADSLARAQKFQLEATYLTLTSNVVNAAVQEASLRAQIAATEKIIKIESDVLTLLKRQLALGQVAQADVLLQETTLAQSEQTLPPLEKQLEQQRSALTALAGRYPSNEIAAKFTLSSLRLPHELPVSVPSKLVEQRPDIRAAEANLQSASALVGVAIADRLPVLNITANPGYSAATVGSLFVPQTAFWSVTGSVASTVFDGFSLYHKQKAAEAALVQADAQYRSTVITAFQNVADSLSAIQYDARSLKAAVKAEDAASKSLDIVRKQAEAGAVNILAVLAVQQTFLQASIIRVQALANRYSDTAALFQALGGGWWNRNDIEPYDPLKPELDAIIPVKAFGILNNTPSAPSSTPNIQEQ